MTGDLWPSFAASPQKDWRFSYTAWLYFWDRQIERSGKPTFLRFERACFSRPQACRTTFAQVYGLDLRKAVEEFQADARSGRLVPPDRVVPQRASRGYAAGFAEESTIRGRAPRTLLSHSARRARLVASRKSV